MAPRHVLTLVPVFPHTSFHTCKSPRREPSLKNSLAVQGLGLQAPNARDKGSTPGWVTKILPIRAAKTSKKWKRGRNRAVESDGLPQRTRGRSPQVGALADRGLGAHGVPGTQVTLSSSPRPSWRPAKAQPLCPRMGLRPWEPPGAPPPRQPDCSHGPCAQPRDENKTSSQ